MLVCSLVQHAYTESSIARIISAFRPWPLWPLSVGHCSLQCYIRCTAGMHNTRPAKSQDAAR